MTFVNQEHNLNFTVPYRSSSNKKEKEGFEKFGWQCRVFNSKEEIGNGGNPNQITCVIKAVD